MTTKFIIALFLYGFYALSSNAQPSPHITPQQAGYSPEKLEQWAGFIDDAGSSSLMLIHDGAVFFSWGDIH